MLSIHINLSAGAQNIIGAYVIIMLICNNAFTWKSSCVIAKLIKLEKQQKLFVQGYNLEVHSVGKTSCHCNWGEPERAPH